MDVRRTFAAGLATALLASPAAAETRAPSSPHASLAAPPAGPSSELALRVGALVGWERADRQDALSLRVDGEVPIQAVGERLLLSGVGSLGFTRFSASSGNVSATTTLWKVVPAARFTLPVAPRAGVYGDAGAGLYYGRTSEDAGFGNVTTQNVGVTLRVAMGALYDVTHAVRLGAEAGLNPFFGGFDHNTYDAGVVAMFRL